MHQRLFVSLLLLAFVSSGLAILCDTCHGKCGCLRPRSEECPPDTICYMVTKGNFYEKKGCTSSCDEIGVNCRECNEDNCNRTPMIPYGYTGYEECDEAAVQIGGGAGPIGSGAGPSGPRAGIGHGVKPNGVGSTLLSSSVALLSVFYVLQ